MGRHAKQIKRDQRMTTARILTMLGLTEQALANDMNICDIGITMTRGKTKARYIKHRKACFAEIKRLNDIDGLAYMSDDELLAELGI